MAGRLVVGSDLAHLFYPVPALSRRALFRSAGTGRAAPALDLNVFTAAAQRAFKCYIDEF
jgi:hypothetical protein